MTAPFQQRFVALAAERSALCVGIDPSTDALRGWGLPDTVQGLGEFCDRMVAVCAPVVAAVKPQTAFFQRHGSAGMEVLRRTVAGIREAGALAIIDAKCGDIATTAAAYGDAFLGLHAPFAGDAVTASPYLGFGSLAPIVEIALREGAGVFVVVRSSNPEGGALQRAVMADGRSVADTLADQITATNADALRDGLGPIGAVVGATLGDEAAAISTRLPNALLLVPGIGAQGATIADVRGDFGGHYRRVIPSVSRAIASAGPDAASLRRQVERLVAEVRGAG